VRSYGSVPLGKAVPYRHRDPAWLTPDRLAEFTALDARRARYERPQDKDAQSAAREARIAEFTRLRAKGMTVPQAADAMGINRSTGRGYERARRRNGGSK
jgi:hypothetical protein